MSVILKIENLFFSYGRAQILSDVSLDVMKGEMLALLGANGVGKSTLFRCILGLERGYKGNILFGEVSQKEIPTRDLAKRIAFVPQSHSPTFNYSVFDMVLMGTTSQFGSLKMPTESEASVAEESLARVGITHLKDRGYMKISGGERQLTLIARALAQKAEIIVMDEPTANLDYGNGLRVLKQIKELTSDGITIIQSTHTPDHAFLFADRVVTIVDGKVSSVGTPNDVLTPSEIYALYKLDVKIVSDGGTKHVLPIF